MTTSKNFFARKAGVRLHSIEMSRNMMCIANYVSNLRGGEFTVARDQYVRPNTGWFSDRTACYLAAGRPVITQETGFSKFLPTGKGLFGFKTMDDILKAVDTIESDYDGHCRAAREIAAGIFRRGKSGRQSYAARRSMRDRCCRNIGRSGLGGQAWASLQYLIGLRALGHEVFYLEDCGESSWVYNWEKTGMGHRSRLSRRLCLPSLSPRASVGSIATD